jgi:hypothetical protein
VTALRTPVSPDSFPSPSLLELGVRDSRFGSTPLEWARHASQDAPAAFLAPLTG